MAYTHESFYLLKLHHDYKCLYAYTSVTRRPDRVNVNRWGVNDTGPREDHVHAAQNGNTSIKEGS